MEARHIRQGERLYGLMQENSRLQGEALVTLKECLDRSEGRASGMSQCWGVLMGLVGTVVAIAALFNARRRMAG